MKKKIALLLLLTLALTAVFAACNRTEPTKIIPRWSTEGESYEYVLTLADFNTSPNATTHFNTKVYGDEIYFKDFVVRNGEPLDDMDQVRPIAVTGTFTITLSSSDDGYDTVRTEQNLTATYENKDGNLIDQTVLQKLKKGGFVVGDVGDTITLKSSTVTSVEFKHDASQAPRKSSTKVEGFYVGKTHQEVSDYEIATEYKYESKKTVVEIKLTTTDVETKESSTNEFTDEIKRYTEGSFIDSNQMFTYTRSLDKSPNSFADNPSISVYNPFNQTLQSASFAFTPTANAILKDSARDEEIYTKVPTVGVVVGGMPFMLQESVPNLKEQLPDLFDEVGNGPDRVFYGLDTYAKHTPVRFRVGYISFELKSYDDVIWNALKATANSEK